MIGGVAWGVASALILAGIAGKPNDLLLPPLNLDCL